MFLVIEFMNPAITRPPPPASTSHEFQLFFPFRRTRFWAPFANGGIGCIPVIVETSFRRDAVLADGSGILSAQSYGRPLELVWRQRFREFLVWEDVRSFTVHLTSLCWHLKGKGAYVDILGCIGSVVSTDFFGGGEIDWGVVGW